MQSIEMYKFLIVFLTFTVTSVVSSRCGKVFYDQDNYYKIYCFKVNGGISSIKLTNNVTIEQVQFTDNRACFKTMKPQQTNYEISCWQELEEDCEGDNDVYQIDWKEESGIIKCKKVKQEESRLLPSGGIFGERIYFHGIKNGNLTVIFKTLIVENLLVYVPNRKPKRE
ncbi:uncharacterized protein LOC114335800 isoform X1 [Diabrotica virgifera virgifera]|uniref:Uncharacterized protein n=1 Tax=Diabrotica virgifera virgifera TaxID=50390 RepID=A0ABM5IU08_DIAVI|nr:uncharacterized protein LOC114335800 isoform X1 [Diabrotica virgifera virgifera]